MHRIKPEPGFPGCGFGFDQSPCASPTTGQGDAVSGDEIICNDSDNDTDNGSLQQHFQKVAHNALFCDRIGISVVFLCKKENLRTWRKTLGGRTRTINKLNSHMTPCLGINPGHTGGRRVLSPQCHPHSPSSIQLCTKHLLQNNTHIYM